MTPSNSPDAQEAEDNAAMLAKMKQLYKENKPLGDAQGEDELEAVHKLATWIVDFEFFNPVNKHLNRFTLIEKYSTLIQAELTKAAEKEFWKGVKHVDEAREQARQELLDELQTIANREATCLNESVAMQDFIDSKREKK